ncbi:hypothetical protein KG892_05185 [Vermiphilus pyriformis]|nr:MAG: hypothetical protein KG892_05185 [Vermiphilus pyriformis]
MKKIIHFLLLLTIIAQQKLHCIEKKLEKNEIPSLKIFSGNAIAQDLLAAIKSGENLEDFKNIYITIDEILLDKKIKNITQATISRLNNALMDYTILQIPDSSMYFRILKNNPRTSEQSFYHICIGMLAIEKTISSNLFWNNAEDILNFIWSFTLNNNSDEALVIQELLIQTVKILLNSASTISDYFNPNYIKLITCASHLLANIKASYIDYSNLNYSRNADVLYNLLKSIVKKQVTSLFKNTLQDCDIIEKLENEFIKIKNILEILETMIPSSEYSSVVSQLSKVTSPSLPRLEFDDLCKYYTKISDIVAISVIEYIFKKYIYCVWLEEKEKFDKEKIDYDFINHVKTSLLLKSLPADICLPLIQELDDTIKRHKSNLRDAKIKKIFSCLDNDMAWFGISFSTGMAFILSTLKTPIFIASRLTKYPFIIRYGLATATIPLSWSCLLLSYGYLIFATHSAEPLDLGRETAAKSGLVLGAVLTSGALGMYTYLNNKK